MRPSDGDLACKLIVAPEVGFDALSSALGQEGWSRADDPDGGPSLIAGEPEHASWTRSGRAPHVVYTFNPLAMLRVLDVETLSPDQRGHIADRVDLVHPTDVVELLSGPEPAHRLLGLWAARETDRVDLLDEIHARAEDTDATVSEEALRIHGELEILGEARLELARALRLVAAEAEDTLRSLGDLEVVRALRPSREELEILFDPTLAGDLDARLGEMFARPQAADPGDPSAELEVTAATARLLRWSNELSARFPGGYRGIAGWMEPSATWITWAWRSHAGGAVRYDGLARVPDRWVWVPKPFRLIRPLVMAREGGDAGA